MNPILDVVDIHTLIRMLNLDMKEHSSYFMGLCPFHQEKSPSFSIKKSGFYRCFSCGETGSINKLVFHLTGKSIYKFLNIQDVTSFHFESSLKQKKDRTQVKIKPIEVKGQLFEISEDKDASDYLRSRNIPQEFIDYFDIKFARYCEVNDTKFTKRIMIPIYQEGRLTGYEGRAINKINKPKVLYAKGTSVSSLFNIDNLDREKPLYICEGTFDIALIHTHISENTTHIFGAAISNQQKQLLSEFKEIIVFLDNDEAGEKVALQIDEFYPREFIIAKSDISGQDPGDLSLEEIKTYLSNAKPSIEYFLEKSKLFEEEKLEWGNL